MNINGLGSKLQVGNQQKTQKDQGWKSKFYFHRFKEEVTNKKDSYERYNEELVATIAGSYEYYSIKHINRIKESGQVEMTSVQEANVRNLSYEDSDHVQVNVAKGYTYRAQVDVSGHSVYLEYRDDSGAVKAYVADVPSIRKDTENPIEQLALASWNKVLEENRQALGFTEYQKPIETDAVVPGTYTNGCFVSEMETYENTIYLGKFGDACGMAGIFGGNWSDYYPMEPGNEHPESMEVKLFTGRTIIVDVDRISQISQLKAVLSKAEYAQLEELLEEEAGSIRMPQEKWEKLLKRTDDALEDFKEQIRLQIKQQEKERKAQKPKLNVPYSDLVNEDGVIVYNGVVFTCDEEKNAICLGDMSNMDNVLIIPLSDGGSLYVNRDNFGDLARAITMFSAEDRNRIMRAIQQDIRVQQLKQEIEDEKASVGETMEERGEVTDADGETKKEDGQKSTFEAESGGGSQIVVKPDGSRVLVVTTKIGQMETTMSIELSQPSQELTDEQNSEDLEEQTQFAPVDIVNEFLS